MSILSDFVKLGYFFCSYKANPRNSEAIERISKIQADEAESNS